MLRGVRELAVELHEPRTSHEHVDGKQVPVFRGNDGAVPRPNDARARDSRLLSHGDGFGRAPHIRDVGEGDGPFDGWRPKVHGKGTGGMSQHGRELWAVGHDLVLHDLLLETGDDRREDHDAMQRAKTSGGSARKVVYFDE